MATISLSVADCVTRMKWFCQRIIFLLVKWWFVTRVWTSQSAATRQWPGSLSPSLSHSPTPIHSLSVARLSSQSNCHVTQSGTERPAGYQTNLCREQSEPDWTVRVREQNVHEGRRQFSGRNSQQYWMEAGGIRLATVNGKKPSWSILY